MVVACGAVQPTVLVTIAVAGLIRVAVEPCGSLCLGVKGNAAN
jgi:hypothetical protein